MKYCVIKGATRTITQGEDEESLINQALETMLEGKYFMLEDFEILTVEEYQARVELEPIPIAPMTDTERIAGLETTIMGLMDMVMFPM